MLSYKTTHLCRPWARVFSAADVALFSEFILKCSSDFERIANISVQCLVTAEYWAGCWSWVPGHRAFLAGSFLPSLSPAVQFLPQCSLCPRESPSTAPIQTSSRDLLATEQTPCDSERKDDARRAVVSSPYPNGPVGQITNHPLPLRSARCSSPASLGHTGIRRYLDEETTWIFGQSEIKAHNEQFGVAFDWSARATLLKIVLQNQFHYLMCGEVVPFRAPCHVQVVTERLSPKTSPRSKAKRAQKILLLCLVLMQTALARSVVYPRCVDRSWNYHL